MTEAEWLASDDPSAMLDYLCAITGSTYGGPAERDHKPSDRKFRLFACACCRAVWDRLTDPRSRTAVGVAERHADGMATDAELTAASAAAWAATSAAASAATSDAASAAWAAAWAAAQSAAWAADRAADRAAARAAARDAARDATRKSQAALLRDIVGNPWRPAPPAACHCGACVPRGAQHHNGPCARRRLLTPTVTLLAQAAYEERSDNGTLDSLRLAVLADALEETGCGSDDLLFHLRSPGPHVRGCWAVDAILGKE